MENEVNPVYPVSMESREHVETPEYKVPQEKKELLALSVSQDRKDLSDSKEEK